ncbi:hypothetical protein [Pseudomonas sp. P8_250]|uniref:hypothetical protein n=1 Tax=Pseudomonas sp. P8_250 TaxID=3043446 RepID=UPI002A3636A4|nr:hypothetical protein [Pseudomonas sp. P8_250]MDX9668769.1 hypothetical protein [Pseudomonas sp. P8_250]
MAATPEEKIAFIKLRIGDVTTNPIFPMFTDEEYTTVLNGVSGNIERATRMMAISATMIVGSVSTREVVGDIEVQNVFATNYLKALDYLINDPSSRIPVNLMPWVAGLDSRPTKLAQSSDLSCGCRNGDTFSSHRGPTIRCSCGC